MNTVPVQPGTECEGEPANEIAERASFMLYGGATQPVPDVVSDPGSPITNVWIGFVGSLCAPLRSETRLFGSSQSLQPLQSTKAGRAGLESEVQLMVPSVRMRRVRGPGDGGPRRVGLHLHAEG